MEGSVRIKYEDEEHLLDLEDLTAEKIEKLERAKDFPICLNFPITVFSSFFSLFYLTKG